MDRWPVLTRLHPHLGGEEEAKALATLLAEATATLAAAGIEEPRREARLLLAHATQLDAAALLRRLPFPHPAPGFADMVQRRAAREPMAYIVGRQPFWTLDLFVTPDTLIPRADSETLIEAARDLCAERRPARILDLGTGTGCLLLAALVEFPEATGVGVDRAASAAWLARCNAQHAGLSGRAAFLCGDWAAALSGRFDLVLSNPPYIDTRALGRLMPEVRGYEPVLALDGGQDGLTAYRAILAALPGLLSPGGIAILELGAGQAVAVAEIARANGLRTQPPRRDLGGIERALPILPGGKKTFGEPGRHG